MPSLKLAGPAGKLVLEAAKRAAAEGFLNLPRVSSHVTQEYWYEFRAVPGMWDSALVSSDGTLRTSYCVLALGMTPTVAARTPTCNSPTAATAGPSPNAGLSRTVSAPGSAS